MKEHHDEQTDDNNRERKSSIDEIPIEEVHTVNDWEHADLGDEQRKQKFLRLMGAKKRKDESRPDPTNTTYDDALTSEKKHCRSKTQNETINRELEKQFNEGLQSKILHTHHEGLGFHGMETNTDSNSDHWHNQQIKTNFIPATTQTGLSSTFSEIVIKESEKVNNKSNGDEKQWNKSTS